MLPHLICEVDYLRVELRDASRQVLELLSELLAELLVIGGGLL